MPAPTLLSDIIQPAWQALTPEQRTCWHFWAAAHPQMDESGELRTLYGQQAHYARNSIIAASEAGSLLDDPPSDEQPPPAVVINSYAWPLQSLVDGTTTKRTGWVYLEVIGEIPAEAIITVRQGYDRKRTGKGRPPRIRHVTIMQPLTTGVVQLDVPSGYYATTGGENRYARIKAVTARRRPELPLGTIKITRTTNGKTVRQLLTNPYGGARTKINRPRATAVKPRPGDHYP